MASCVCGADIRWVVRDDTGELIPVEAHAELGPGEGRFIVTGGRPDGRQLVTEVNPRSEVEAYTDHRRDCPDHGNGLVPPAT